MVLQNIIMPNTICEEKELYYQSNGEIEFSSEYIIVPQKVKISFFSYLNMFDFNAWKKYTLLKKIEFQVQIKGIGSLFLKSKTKEKDEVIMAFDLHQALDSEWRTITYEINLDKEDGCCYFEILAESEILIRNACFTAITDDEYINDVMIALNICTYHRNQEVERNLEQLRNSFFFSEQDQLFQKLQIMVVDNGSELERIEEPYIRLVHNPNTGGSGGFKRGLEELRNWREDTTHVVFMDDDVEFQLESLYRLYSLLSFMKEEYKHEPIAGRMFRTDLRHVQYTAAEIWNKGDLRHIGLNADMTLEKEILLSNENADAEYGGWWFCCYPMGFVKKNDPLPFFIHCDDVEYGLRHGGTPIILNGIQVWHETYEYRQSPEITYYDMRNSFIVNAIYEDITKQIVIEKWKKVITHFHVKKDYKNEYIAVKAMYDFLRGKNFFFRNGDKKVKLIKNIHVAEYLNKIMWRYCYWVLSHKYLSIKKGYREE